MIKGIILHPFVSEIKDVYETNYWRSFHEVDLGAIPLSPDKDQLLVDYLNDLLQKDYSGLCILGLPYESAQHNKHTS